MSDRKTCDYCSKLIAEGADIITMNVNGGCELTQNDKGTDYDLHESCWKKIKKTLKVSE